jgi:hypothetical protein
MTPLTLTKFLLWSSLTLSAITMIAIPLDDRATSIRIAQLDAVGDFDGRTPIAQREHEQYRLVRRQANALNYFLGAPTIFVLSAGFLAVVSAVEQSARAVIAAVTVAGPDATAAAMRRAVPAAMPLANPRDEAAMARAPVKGGE